VAKVSAASGGAERSPTHREQGPRAGPWAFGRHAGKPEIEFVRDRFAISEAMTYYQFILETAIREGA
jgi:hypothetical protein